MIKSLAQKKDSGDQGLKKSVDQSENCKGENANKSSVYTDELSAKKDSTPESEGMKPEIIPIQSTVKLS